MVDENGRAVDMGKILYGRLVTSGKVHSLYRYASAVDGSIDYYDEKGQSAKKFLMKTPVDGARLSSGYGMRFHPILGYTKMHKGVDFAAPRGTPVMAAGQGTVEFASRNGSYGNYVRIRHGNGYKTAYAHLNSFARGIKKGAHVRQGQIIGYVGTTGRSTGPHLHYEIMLANKQVNPMSIRVPTGRKLAGSELAAFATARVAIETDMAQATVLSSTATADIAPPASSSVNR
jgi:murein DD-endopeptidase MepM/ murein hydrolase activator NlpD